ncbi:23S rRNA (pseudouridine(1915)-N(3))-methyltransferase RlmH [Roseburia sp. NSJ-9]|uniref:Ribosomal RNA large subunit methyltransferase H n=1 Tax=Roseburia lenta TaxID=2763061 RepID=A0ABR7GCE6_9FIRM|nr:MULTISPECIES: 23S rRNA (pseudouridine(1915)-N(3))-methyltransferase RlmH [Roseburia]MBC5685118.1 23S rRNA (pseudouridine(1915)-N(3))-methyltransferase RlmH [Roseburia lenta]RHO32215.1 23S rRNA (pseudouridine(1915)-N(3))-methyltransferase RlmH [Roseburia sp. AM16-25]
MNITILCVGQIKEKYFRDAIAEYQKRLSRYCKLQMIEVADEKTKENASEAENDLIRKKEGERLLKHIKDSDYCITLEIDGRMLTSEGLSKEIDRLGLAGKSSLVFVIGGSIGLDTAVLKRSDYALSFSKMTFPHQLMRVILLEQIYRSYRIMRGEPYHK